MIVFLNTLEVGILTYQICELLVVTFISLESYEKGLVAILLG